MTNPNAKDLKNHFVFALDVSDSMRYLIGDLAKAADSIIRELASKSEEYGQETRITVYSFNTTVTCHVFDMDVLRFRSLYGSVAGMFASSGRTALVGATIRAIRELKKIEEAALYGDHAFVLYAMTDGEENATGNSNYERQHYIAELAQTIKQLPVNWTVAALVPTRAGVSEAQSYGFPAKNVAVWNTTSVGLHEAGTVITQSANNFMQARSQGVRGTTGLFEVSTASVTTRDLQTAKKLSKGAYGLYVVAQSDFDSYRYGEGNPAVTGRKAPVDVPIKWFVENKTGRPYVLGSTYYELVRPTEVQVQKVVLIRDRFSGEVYTGPEARKIIGLPDYTVKVTPGQHGNFDVFVQSTSTNRNLPVGSSVIIP
jgi:hypothetical protein